MRIVGPHRRVGKLNPIERLKLDRHVPGEAERLEWFGLAPTAPPSSFLASGDVDGAVVSEPSGDRDEPWIGVVAAVHTPGELAPAAESIYNQTMALAELDPTRYPPSPARLLVGRITRRFPS